MAKQNVLEKLGFEKINIESASRGVGRKSEKPTITLAHYGSTHQLRLNKALVDLANIQGGSRYDLYNLGSTFILLPCEVGCLRIVQNKSTYTINSVNAFLEIRSRIKDKNKINFEAWLEDGAIFFK